MFSTPFCQIPSTMEIICNKNTIVSLLSINSIFGLLLKVNLIPNYKLQRHQKISKIPLNAPISKILLIKKNLSFLKFKALYCGLKKKNIKKDNSTFWRKLQNKLITQIYKYLKVIRTPLPVVNECGWTINSQCKLWVQNAIMILTYRGEKICLSSYKTVQHQKRLQKWNPMSFIKCTACCKTFNSFT